MKILLDFLPILLFFGAYKLYDIYLATGVLMAATLVQMGVVYAMERRLQTLHKITLALVLVFGMLTLLLHDERFIKWKPTVLYAAMGLALAFTVLVLRKNFLKMLLGSQLDLPDFVWMKLNWAWVLYCLFMAAVNAYVVVGFSTEQWVNFKLWGYVFPLAFIVGQGLYVSRYLRPDAEITEITEADAKDKP
ncbi:septation protein A [Pseudorhodoferax sp.]|uniref:septation protein A n=1 Tax=Pseudorhodoferax sp. TaxID=1993553 RepID=UPI0039E5BF8C